MNLYKYLTGRLTEANLGTILDNLSLKDVKLKDFTERYGDMTEDEMIEYIRNPKNMFDLSNFGYHITRQHIFPAHYEYSYDEAQEMY